MKEGGERPLAEMFTFEFKTHIQLPNHHVLRRMLVESHIAGKAECARDPREREKKPLVPL